MAGCSQPVGNMGMSQGAGIACNGDKDMSGAAYCLDKDVSASSAIQKASYCNNSQSHTPSVPTKNAIETFKKFPKKR